MGMTEYITLRLLKSALPPLLPPSTSNTSTSSFSLSGLRTINYQSVLKMENPRIVIGLDFGTTYSG